MIAHATLRDQLWSRAAAVFVERGWDPRGRQELGAAFLDACALALHVAWTYQAAWGEEQLLGTANLTRSVDRLLAHIGYVPGPGVSAEGFQIFVARQGTDVVLPAGSEVSGTVPGAPSPVTFATTRILRLRSDRNEVVAWLPPSSGSSSGTTVVNRGSAGLGPASAGTPSGALRGHVRGLQKMDEAARRAAVARQRARVLADLRGEGAIGACADSVESLCAQLCADQDAAAQAAALGDGPGPVSESQALLDRQLARLEATGGAAFEALTALTQRREGEPLADWNARVATMARFLDLLVGGLVQDARDQVALLQGASALARLDQALGRPDPTRPTRGRAPAGTDLLFLVGPGGVTGLADVVPGDWFAFGEDIEARDANGKLSTRRVWREVARVARVRSVQPPGRIAPLTEVQFESPLRRGYDLDRTVLCGNVVPIREGARRVEQPVLDGPVLPLRQAPLAWRREPWAPRGRAPQIDLWIDGQPWSWRPDLIGAHGNQQVYAIEHVPGGGDRVRFGDGGEGAAPRPGASVRVEYRVGVGAAGNVAARVLDVLTPSRPEVAETYNPFPTSGGADPEPVAVSRKRGPMIVATRDRAVSLEDLRASALEVDGVLRARAFRRGTARRAETVVVVAGERGRALVPEELRVVTEALSARVPPLVQVRVENRLRVGIRANILLRVEPWADPIELVAQVRARLGLVPTDPPGLLDPSRVDLDDDLALSAIYGAVDGVPGLRSTVVNALWREDRAPGLSERIVAHPRELLTWADGADACELRWALAVELP